MFVAVALVLALGLAAFAVVQRNQAVANSEIAKARELAALSSEQRRNNPQLGLALAVAAVDVRHVREADAALRSAAFDDHLALVLRGHRGRVHGAAFAGSDRRIMSAGADGTVRTWDVDGKPRARVLEGHEGAVFSVDVDRAARTAISTGRDGTVRIWDPAAGQRRLLAGGEGASVGGAVDAGGRHAVAAFEDGTIGVWDLRRRMPPRLLRMPQALTVAMDPAGAQVMSGAADGRVRVWDLRRPELPREWSFPGAQVYATAFSADGRRAVAAADDGTVSVFDVDGGAAPRTLRGHQGQVFAASFDASEATGWPAPARTARSGSGT